MQLGMFAAEVQIKDQDGDESGILNMTWLLVRDGVISVFQKLLIYCAVVSRVYREWSEKRRENIPCVAVPWVKIPCCCQTPENDQTASK